MKIKCSEVEFDPHRWSVLVKVNTDFGWETYVIDTMPGDGMAFFKESEFPDWRENDY